MERPATRFERVIGALLLSRRHRPLTLWLLATLTYGAVAGLLLHDHPAVAGAVVMGVWVAAVWRAPRPPDDESNGRRAR